MTQRRKPFSIAVSAVLLSNLAVPLSWNRPAGAATSAYCQLSPNEVQRKESLRQAALSGRQEAIQSYFAVLAEHARAVSECRSRTWPQTQAIWLRLYPCDARPGEIDRVLDQIVNKGYNQVYLEVFYDGQVLLPAADNPTVWPSVLRTPGYEKFDMLSKALNKGRARGLKMYAWLFSLNLGYTYSQRPDRQQTLARNGQGQTSVTVAQEAGIDDRVGDANHVFVDPYSPQVRQDYSTMVNAILRRQPQGMLFDYIRYLRGVGPASVVTRVQDLWIYGEASQQALLQRAQNQQGRDLIQRYLSKGFVNANDLQAVFKQYPGEKEPLWQGRTPLNPPTTTATVINNRGTAVAAKPPAGKPDVPPAPIRPSLSTLQKELWQLSVAHATQGIIDFLAMASGPAQRMGLPAGAVFFPDGNRPVNQGGFDSRLQPWDRFPANIEFHAMSYGNCGNMSCILPQVQRVTSLAPAGAQIIPAIAGGWGQAVKNRPSLEVQMQAIRAAAPQINAISHFSYSWQEPKDDHDRRSCRI